MTQGKISGLSLSNRDASIVLGMQKRGDREHDIAAWFGVNQGRIAEVKAGSHGVLQSAMSWTCLRPDLRVSRAGAYVVPLAKR